MRVEELMSRAVVVILVAGALALVAGCASQARLGEPLELAGDVAVVEVTAPRADTVVDEVVVIAAGPRMVLPEVCVFGSRPPLTPAVAGRSLYPGGLVN